jgi:RNA polymerase sigma factor (TIGR02999 family)
VVVNDSTPQPQTTPGAARLSSDELLPLVYDELRRLANARMAREKAGQTLQATALVHDAWLELAGDRSRTWQSRAHFFGAAALAMRRILMLKARRKSRLKHGGGQERVNLDGLEVAAASPEDDLLLLDEALDRLEVEDPEQAHIVILKYFGGFTNEEVARNLGLSPRTVDRQWACAKAWLYQWMRQPQ